jgi:hypothetical protein
MSREVVAELHLPALSHKAELDAAEGVERLEVATRLERGLRLYKAEIERLRARVKELETPHE